MYFGVGSFGSSNSLAGNCYRLSLAAVNRDMIVQVVNFGGNVPAANFDLQMVVAVGDCSIHAQETAPIRLSNSSPNYHNGVLNMEDVHSISHVATLFHRIHTVHQPIHLLLMTWRTFAEDLS